MGELKMNELLATIKYLPILYQVYKQVGLRRTLRFDLGVTLFSLGVRCDNLEDYLDD